MADVWSEFAADPRDPAHASLRASDRDRDVVQGVLGEAYAAGRLTREELDERSDTALAARTLGELPPLILDLAPTTSVVHRAAPPATTAATAEQVREQAVARWRRERREAVWGALSASLICVVIWLLTGLGQDVIFWPGFVILGTGLNVGRVLLTREQYVEERIRQLEQRQERMDSRRSRRERREPRDD